ncbi:hypothetical protein [Prosthecobacter sp.]|uniref:hypothetical protein n=1 Tax=Prosthecobacter sp. TaxID=1965333 RepID=UPI003784186F
MTQKPSSHEILTPDGIPVHCLHSAIVPADQLKLFPGNYRKHKPKQLDRMLKVVNGNGWRRCAVVSNLSGCVIKGNGMVQLAQRNGLHVPIEYQDYKSRAEELRDLVADNKLAELAEDDDEALRKLLSEIDSSELECAAVTSEELEALIRDAEIPDAEFPITAKLHERYDYVLVFTTNESDFAFLQTLTGVEPERSYKKSGVGIGRAIPFPRFLKSIRENRHSLDVQGEQHDHAPAGAGGAAVRA